MKWQIDNFNDELEKLLDDTKLFDGVRSDFYIDGMDEADEAAHGYGSNTPSDEAYGYMSIEERPNLDN